MERRWSYCVEDGHLEGGKMTIVEVRGNGSVAIVGKWVDCGIIY